MWTYNYTYPDELYHHGIKGMKWGVRRYQNADGTLTAAGKKKYGTKENYEYVTKEAKIARKYGTTIKAVNKVPGKVDTWRTKDFNIKSLDAMGGDIYYVDSSGNPMSKKTVKQVGDEVVSQSRTAMAKTAIEVVATVAAYKVGKNFMDGVK